MASAKTPKGFEGLRCPHCGETDTLSVQVDDLTLSCRECSEDVTRADVEAVIDAYSRLLKWIDSAAAVLAAPETE